MENLPPDASHVAASFLYLQRDSIHAREKPYKLRYDPGEDISRTNTKNEKRDGIIINDVRGNEQGHFEERGYTWLRLESALLPEQFYDKDAVRTTYYAELRALLQRLLNPSHIEILEHTCRKRHEEFPIATGAPYEYLQPTTIAHLDYTPGSAEGTATCLGAVSRENFARMQAINIWKPLHGPVKDWPLALCDPRSVDFLSDVVPVDVVFRDSYTENAQLYYSPGHKWVYLSDQLESEVAIFLQYDSATENGAGVPHSSFHNQHADGYSKARESIEVRAFVFYE